jgi:hypothetical protein
MKNEEQEQSPELEHTDSADCPACRVEFAALKKELIGLPVTDILFHGPEGGFIELDHRFKIKFPVALVMKRQVQ